MIMKLFQKYQPNSQLKILGENKRERLKMTTTLCPGKVGRGEQTNFEQVKLIKLA